MPFTPVQIQAVRDAIAQVATTGQTVTLPSGMSYSLPQLDELRSLLREMEADAGLIPAHRRPVAVHVDTQA